MNSFKIFLVIATHDRINLLKRTLKSVAHCVKPANFGGVVIVENGPVKTLPALFKGDWRELFETLKIQYSHHPIANKSSALNSILESYRGQYLYFIDDDVRLATNTLIEMANAVVSMPENVFLGGPVECDYEDAPPEWLLNYLPSSAKGFRITDFHHRVQAPYFLGANWLVKADHLISAGGFSLARGPNEVALGQESQMQLALKRMGLHSFYVEKALVWHYVSAERSTPQWALERIVPQSTATGLLAVESQREFIVLVNSIFGWFLNAFMTEIYGRLNLPHKSYHSRFQKAVYWGQMKGIKYGWKQSIKLAWFPFVLIKRAIEQVAQPLVSELKSLAEIVMGAINSICIRRDPMEFSYLLAKTSQYHNNALSFSLYTTSACGLHCSHCISLDQMKANEEYHLSLNSIETFLETSEKSRYRFDIILTGGEPLLWKQLKAGVQLLRRSRVCNSLVLLTNALHIENMDRETAECFEEIRVSVYPENSLQALRFWKQYPSLVRIFSGSEFWKAPKYFASSRLPVDCLSPEQGLFQDRIYACSHSQSLAIRRRNKELKLYNELKLGFLKDVLLIRKKQERDLCAFCIYNRNVRKGSYKIKNVGLKGWLKLQPSVLHE